MVLPRLLDTITLFLVVTIALLWVKKDRRPIYAFLFLAVYLIARLVNVLPVLLNFHIEGLIFNWFGHIFQIAWVLIFLWLSPLKAKDIGLTFKQRPDTIRPAVLMTIGLIVFKVGLTALSGGRQLDELMTEQWLFELTMPPLAQEFLHSGLLLSLLIIALGGSKVDQKDDWTSVIVIALVINAFSHGIKFGLQYDPGLQFNFMVFFTPFLGKLAYGWLRLSTGSLLFPVLAFSLSNLGVLLVDFFMV